MSTCSPSAFRCFFKTKWCKLLDYSHPAWNSTRPKESFTYGGEQLVWQKNGQPVTRIFSSKNVFFLLGEAGWCGVTGLTSWLCRWVMRRNRAKWRHPRELDVMYYSWFMRHGTVSCICATLTFFFNFYFFLSCLQTCFFCSGLVAVVVIAFSSLMAFSSLRSLHGHEFLARKKKRLLCPTWLGLTKN